MAIPIAYTLSEIVMYAYRNNETASKYIGIIINSINVRALHAPKKAEDVENSLNEDSFTTNTNPESDYLSHHYQPPSAKCNKRIVGYYTDWEPRKISAKQLQKLTHLIFTNVPMNSSGHVFFENLAQRRRFLEINRKAQLMNVKVMFSIGGHKNAEHYSTVVADSTKRSVFIDSIVSFIKSNNASGVDLFWEWPNISEMNDFITTIKELRKKLAALTKAQPKGTRYLLSIIVPSSPSDLEYYLRMDGLLHYVDFLNVLTYGYYAPWSGVNGKFVGPNAPLYGGNRENVDETMQYLICKTRTPSKLNMALSFYGRYWENVNDNVPDEMFKEADLINGKAQGMFVAWKNLAGRGWDKSEALWHEETQIPYIWNSEERKFFVFENERSLQAKMDYAADHNIGGVYIWALGADDNNDTLLNVVSSADLPQDGEVFVGPGGKKDAQKIGLGLSKLSSKRKDDIQMAKKYAMDISIKQILLRQQKQQQENQQRQQMYSQALSIMSRIYVGSISFEIREDMLRRAFDPFGPIKSINMSWDPATGHHKTFAFVEYEVPEAALLAQESMNGQMLGGRNLKVNSMMFQEMRLPQNMPQAQPIIDMVQKDAKKYFRVYVSSVHPDLSETDLKSVFEAFGEIVKCQLARAPTGRGHRGFGYLEFNNLTSQSEAIAGMNMFDLGGQYLRVGKCVTPPDALTYLQPASVSAIPASVSVACAAITAKVMAAEAAAGSSPKTPSESGGSRAASPAPRAQSPATPSSSLPTDIENKAVISSPKKEPEEIEVPPLPPSAPDVVKDEPMEIEEEEEYTIPEEKPKPVAIVPPPGLAIPSLVAPPGLIAPTEIGIVVPNPSFLAQQQQKIEEKIEEEEEARTERVKLSTSQRKKMKREKLNQMTFEEKMAQVLGQQKAVQNQRMADPVTFGALDDTVAWKDPSNEDQTSEDGKMLAIMGPGRGGDNVASMALALMDGGSSLMLANNAKAKEAAAALALEPKKKKKVKEGKKIQPKLNTAQALAAAAKAGEMSDALKNEVMNSEDASLASQEGLEIRGNDARHLLMTKLMRTNRSNVIVLRNMVTPQDIDEFLEGEIREECGKYGNVIDVVIANFASSGLVKIFVKYSDSMQVDRAKAALDGRFFGGNTVKAEAYDQILFDHADYTG